MKQITVAIAGCGSRGMDTYAKCLGRMGERVKIVAAADISQEKLAMMREKYGLQPEYCYPSAEAMLDAGRLADVMMICTPDAMHYGEAKRALELDYHLLLEKPIAPEEAQCRELTRIAAERGRQVTVCHVLRYTPFYREMKRIIASGAVGDIVSVQAIEKVCYWHQAHSFVRGNWGNTRESSPMILQKCCHDMDILLWLIGRPLKRVSSFGSLTHFKSANAPEGAPERCTDGCPAAESCPYNAPRFYLTRFREEGNDWPVNVVAPDPTEEKIMTALREGPYGRCVYHCDNDAVDHQVVNLECEGGATVNFTMCAFTAHGGRNLRVMGTKGEIEGDMKQKRIRVMTYDGREQEIDVAKLSDDFSGHGGGDARMVEEMIDRLARDGENAPMSTNIAASLESHLAAFAAERSRLAGGAVISVEQRG